MNARAISGSIAAADLLSLTKPRLSSLVLVTTAGGLWLAPSRPSAATVIVTLIAVAATVAAANTLNCYLERDTDRLMARTRNRPLPAGRMDPLVALTFGLSLAALALPTLALAVNPLTAVLSALALGIYILVYTPMKARSSAAMLVGAIPGALPPVIGWTAATNSISLPALVLFALLFFWQLPHFLAIALFRKKEYIAAGLQSVPIESGDATARKAVVFYSIALLAVSLLLTPLRVAGMLYFAFALLAGASFLGFGLWGLIRGLGEPWARKLFLLSIVYLAAIFLVISVDHVLIA